MKPEKSIFLCMKIFFKKRRLKEFFACLMWIIKYKHIQLFCLLNGLDVEEELKELNVRFLDTSINVSFKENNYEQNH